MYFIIIVFERQSWYLIKKIVYMTKGENGEMVFKVLWAITKITGPKQTWSQQWLNNFGRTPFYRLDIFDLNLRVFQMMIFYIPCQITLFDAFKYSCNVIAFSKYVPEWHLNTWDENSSNENILLIETVIKLETPV